MSQKEKLALGAVVAAAVGGFIYSKRLGLGITTLNITHFIIAVFIIILEIIKNTMKININIKSIIIIILIIIIIALVLYFSFPVERLSLRIP